MYFTYIAWLLLANVAVVQLSFGQDVDCFEVKECEGQDIYTLTGWINCWGYKGCIDAIELETGYGGTYNEDVRCYGSYSCAYTASIKSTDRIYCSGTHSCDDAILKSIDPNNNVQDIHCWGYLGAVAASVGVTHYTPDVYCYSDTCCNKLYAYQVESLYGYGRMSLNNANSSNNVIIPMAIAQST